MGFFTIAHADSDSSDFGLIIGVMFAVIIALAVTVTLVVLRNKRRKRRNRTVSESDLVFEVCVWTVHTKFTKFASVSIWMYFSGSSC